ncbi:hypothetical protein [Mucilaginibacter sp.]|uniref:COG1470 family protein n=1 Tax=Mucilaginibacter sp. TaxID=1882438 RepID=UPI00261FF643|nr:hypothetical protein [Mucilaginibacter sp.]
MSTEIAVAQANHDFRVVFMKDTLYQTGNSFSFNRVTITNISSIKQAIGLDLTVPENWQTLFDNHKIFQLGPNETLELPIRVAASYRALSNKLYPVILTINNSAIGAKTDYHYFAKVMANANWRAALINADVKLDRINKETYFQFRISNTGNVTQQFDINYKTGLNLTVAKRNNHISLQAGRDTIIRVGIIVQKKYLQEFKPQNVEIEISTKDKNQQTFIQHVYSNNTVFFENPSGWYTAPLSVELVSQNFSNKQQKINYINSSGIVFLENQRSLSFNFRSDNFYTENNGASNRYYNVNYATKHWRVSIGDQTEFSAFLIDGFGARIAYKADNGYQIEAVAVKSRVGNADQFNLRQEYLLNKSSGIINNTVLNFDIQQKENSILNITEYDKAFGKAGQLAILGGYGWNSINQPTLTANNTGATAGLRYNYNSPIFAIRTDNNISGRNFPGLERGVSRSSNELRFITGKFFFGGITEYNSRSVTLPDSNKMLSLFGGTTTEYGLRTGFINGRSSLTVTASIVNQLQDSLTNIPFKSNKLNITTGFGLLKNLNFSLTESVSRSFAQGSNYIKPIDAIAAFGTLQTRNSGVNFRLDNGPTYYSDLFNYVRTGIKTNRFQVSPYVEQDFFKSVLTTRVEVDYINDIGNQLKSYGARLDLNINLVKSGVYIRFYGNRNFSRENNLNSLNVSIRKTFDLPLIGLRKYSTLKVILFKDNNGNNIYDLGDEPVNAANIRIGDQYFITNKLGEAYYKNIKPKIYSIDLGQVTNLKGWIAKKGYNQQINFDKSQDWYIGYERSRFLSGSLNLVKDPLSKLEFSPSNIRITAISSKGESYSTLTDENGAFFLNLPADTYLVQINANVFTEEFRVLRENLNADLTTKSEEALVFEVRERKRTINIRKNKSN